MADNGTGHDSWDNPEYVASLDPPVVQEKEKIIAAAMRVIIGSPWRKGERMTFSLMPPARHHELIHIISSTPHMVADAGGDSAQGFLTSKGRFVNRVDAMHIARAAGQTTVMNRSELFSEDLW